VLLWKCDFSTALVAERKRAPPFVETSEEKEQLCTAPPGPVNSNAPPMSEPCPCPLTNEKLKTRVPAADCIICLAHPPFRVQPWPLVFETRLNIGLPEKLTGVPSNPVHFTVGAFEGADVGAGVGPDVGVDVGVLEGADDGENDGENDGVNVGADDDGANVGASVGAVGAALGDDVGLAVGFGYR